MMKKFALLLSAATLALFAASCNDDKDHVTQTYSLQLLNLVSDDNANSPEAAVITPATYGVQLDFTDNAITISGSGVPLMNGASVSFGTPAMKYQAAQGSFKFNLASIPNNTEVSNISGRLAQVASVPNGNSGSIEYGVPMNLVMAYTTPGYTVRTFPADAVYQGTTYISKGQEMNDPVTSTAYRVVINQKEMTATMYIYGAKFDPKMPEMNLVLEGLKVSANSVASYMIKGENIVPKSIPENTPYDRFVFQNITFSTVNADLTGANIEFDIPAVNGHGSFSGYYTLSNN